ncbi:hypothetical protein ACQ5SO_14535 [Rhodovulum sp. DZ06]|uniref:hypothetical protein n=1 Tax=Rhodovulum sp. DZ06 TaxID=3425126 RepID=UPI003D358DBE
MEVVELSARRGRERAGLFFSPDVLAELGAAVGPDMCREIVEDAMLMVTERLISIDHALRRADMAKIERLSGDVAASAARVGMSTVAAQAEALRDCARRADDVACAAVGARLLSTGEASLLAHAANCVG